MLKKGLSSFIYSLLIAHEAVRAFMFEATVLLSHVFVTEGVSCCKFREITGFVIEAHGLIVIEMLDVSIYHVRL